MKTSDISDKAVCEAVRDSRIDRWDNGYRYPYDLLQQRFSAPFKVAWKALERAADRDFIEYGVSLRTAWLTEKGEQLLKETNA